LKNSDYEKIKKIKLISRRSSVFNVEALYLNMFWSHYINVGIWHIVTNIFIQLLGT